ncbi:MAG: YjbQ family protein [Magnetococcales bacterium]|nr:YjbQ family protein [Magnetococcales bacterium]
MQTIINIRTRNREELIDITGHIESAVRSSGVRTGLVALFAQGATAGIMIQENWDESVQRDAINLLARLIPRGVWMHDNQDGNGDAHLKSGLVGPSESIPIIDGRLGLSTWQNIFFCEFDGPRDQRSIICTILADR